MDELINDSITQIINKYPNDYKSIFQLLSIFFKRIIDNPNNKESYQIKISNSIFKEKTEKIPEILSLIELIGYCQSKEDKNIYIIEKDCIENVNIANKILINVISKSNSKINTNPSSNNNNNYSNNLTSGQKVIIYQYDLTMGLARSFGSALIGRQIEGVWHTAVVCFGKEYFYGGGIQVGIPKQTPYGKPVKELDFGYTNKTEKEFSDFIKTIDNKYCMQTYDILYNNCNHFTDAAAYFLTGRHLPDSILKQHEELLNTPLGNMIRPYLEMMRGQNNSFLPNMFENNNNNFGGNNNIGGNNNGRGYFY